MTEPDYSYETRQMQRGSEIRVQAAGDACDKALKAIGVYLTGQQQEELYLALERIFR